MKLLVNGRQASYVKIVTHIHNGVVWQVDEQIQDKNTYLAIIRNLEQLELVDTKDLWVAVYIGDDIVNFHVMSLEDEEGENPLCTYQLDKRNVEYIFIDYVM